MGRVTQSADWLVEGLAGWLGFFSAPVLDFSLLSSPCANLSVADCHTKAHRHFTDLLSMKRVGLVCSAQSLTTRWMVGAPILSNVTKLQRMGENPRDVLVL